MPSCSKRRIEQSHHRRAPLWDCGFVYMCNRADSRAPTLSEDSKAPTLSEDSRAPTLSEALSGPRLGHGHRLATDTGRDTVFPVLSSPYELSTNTAPSSSGTGTGSATWAAWNRVRGGELGRLRGYHACAVGVLVMCALCIRMWCVDGSWRDYAASHNPNGRLLPPLSWRGAALLFWLRCLFALCQAPYLLMRVPVLDAVLLRGVPTGYDTQGSTVRLGTGVGTGSGALPVARTGSGAPDAVPVPVPEAAHERGSASSRHSTETHVNRTSSTGPRVAGTRPSTTSAMPGSADTKAMAASGSVRDALAALHSSANRWRYGTPTPPNSPLH